MTSAPSGPVTVRVRSTAPARGRSPARRAPSRGRRTPARRSGTRRVAGRRPSATRRQPGRGRGRTVDLSRWWPAVLIATAVLVGVAWDNRGGAMPGSPELCPLHDSSVTVTVEQAENAAIIAQVGRDRGLPERAIVIALATAQQESRLRNLDYGDRDSLGLFQQRPSQGWGTTAQVQDPVYAAGIFYDRLVQVSDWETGRLTDVAQAVQRSGFPELYQQWEPLAEALTHQLSDVGTAGDVCP